MFYRMYTATDLKRDFKGESLDEVIVALKGASLIFPEKGYVIKFLKNDSGFGEVDIELFMSDDEDTIIYEDTIFFDEPAHKLVRKKVDTLIYKCRDKIGDYEAVERWKKRRQLRHRN